MTKYPHTHKCRCDNCATNRRKCDGNDRKSHCFIRVMGAAYLSCMWCGRWLREGKKK